MTAKTFKRRQPKVERKKSSEVTQVQECPGCSHKASEHNQFGCCFVEVVCPCLVPYGKGDSGGEDGV